MFFFSRNTPRSKIRERLEIALTSYSNYAISSLWVLVASNESCLTGWWVVMKYWQLLTMWLWAHSLGFVENEGKKNPTQECYKNVIKHTKKTLHQVQSWNPLYTECSIKNSSVLRTRQEFKNASAFLLMAILSPPLGKSDFWSAPWRESHPHRTLGYPLLLLRPHTLLTSIYSPTLSSWWQMTGFWYQDLPYSSQHMETCTGFAFRISEVLPTKDIVVSGTGSLSVSHLHFSFERWEKK